MHKANKLKNNKSKQKMSHKRQKKKNQDFRTINSTKMQTKI